jgi:murein DD-endopeptidase MepM/ murein hydrolase activator NlpD
VRGIVAAVITSSVIAAAPAVVRGADVAVSVAARSIQPGELAVLTLTTNQAIDDVRVRAFGKDLTPIRTGSREWRVLIGIDLETKPGRYDVSITTAPAGTERITQLLTVLPKTFATRRLTVDAAFVNPPAEEAARIKDDTERLNRVWASSSQTSLWSGAWMRPVPGTANSVFGTRSIYNGEPRSPHSGADFQGAPGTPVKAPNSGRVVLAGDLYFTGNTVVIDHGAGLFSLFAHLRAISVHEGDSVTTGAVLGELGATGRVTGPHLHWAVRIAGARVDPLSLLALLGDSPKP